MRNAGPDEAQAGTKIARRNINNLRYADDTTLMAESEEELKSLSMKVKEKSEKVGLKLNIEKTNIMASNPITSWKIDRKTLETVSDFIFLGSKTTADGNCSHEIKIAPWKKSYDKPRQHIKKQRQHMVVYMLSVKVVGPLPTKDHIVKAMVFLVIMYRYESRTIKKAEHGQIDTFEP